MKESYIQVGLDDSRSKDIADVIGNKTCKKILNFLVDKEATVTDVSNSLKIPLNTTDYNVKKLLKSGLIEMSSHFWSVKGKKMPTYKISNQKIIISPKKFFSAKNFLLGLGFLGFVGVTIKTFFFKSVENDLLADSIEIGRDSAGAMLAYAPQAVSKSVESAPGISSLSGFEWVLIGIWAVLLGVFVYTLIKNNNMKGGKN